MHSSDVHKPKNTMLAYMLHRHVNFREADLRAVADMHGVKEDDLNLRTFSGDHEFSPFRLVDLPNSHAAQVIAQRCMLLKGFFEIWGEGRTLQELKDSIKRGPSAEKETWFREDMSFKYIVDGFGRKVTMPEQVEYINALFDVCPFKGKVDLSKPAVKMWLIICNCVDNVGLPPGIQYRLILAREVALSDRSRIHSFTLKDRRYLGPTSMDTELAFMMCNMAHVQRHDLVFDPFVGTGSILIAAAAKGAHVIGADIDIRVIRDGKQDKKGQPCNVYSNFQDYKLQDPVGLLRSDAHNPPWRGGMRGVFDAIICDPPYGVRAGGRKMIARQREDFLAPKLCAPPIILS